MAALSALIRGDLPPAGNSIALQSASESGLDFANYQTIPLASGTMALALAMLIAKSRHPEITQPEIIIPAYGCPDLIAAAVYAGIKPILVDLAKDSHCFDLELLSAALTKHTLMVLAVNFLGIAERLPDIRQCLKPWPAVSLLEDNAQWFPELSDEYHLNGDYICLSFGRGKPVSLLGGGALLVDKSIDLGDATSLIQQADSGLLRKMKIALYNQLLSPFFYQFLSRNPLLKLGQTVYKPLLQLKAMDRQSEDLMGSNIDQYLAGIRQSERDIAALISNNKTGLIGLAGNAGSRAGRLLRYPVLCESQLQRDDLVTQLVAEGLGVSKLYQQPLANIDGIAELLGTKQEFVEAGSFASRLLTLPLHRGVKDKHLSRLATIF